MNWRELKAQLLKNPEFKEEYDALEPEYRLLRAVIQRRIEKGLTQEELARRVGTRQAAIARFESGRANPTIGFLKKVAAALDADLEVELRPRELR
ncbi:helix-turn-helix domain-containing protein [Desulfovirgula thermocuniculi]|uniref:helix-turn-helix domain-containing protein n=1 Tax=Desulfovirgula thermocuniculi TaxID=348842 RepID=UPI00041C19EE|nr:helix-turn-helix transcriptional regulator [Desulfovirgula thermocuniculi]